MGYDPEYKTRAELWFKIIEELSERYAKSGLSIRPPLTEHDIASMQQKTKIEL